MIVKINGSVFDTERVMRFAPRRKGGLDFRPKDVVPLYELENQEQSLREGMDELPGSNVWTVDKMGWRFLLWSDGYGNTVPQCFAPINGELEYPQE